ncbi:MAG: tetratricopeptide repeat protein, partial [Candidatus ainarchaeum sp.]|nr:tetratricopeptide repeat protein [Candidatus ainarchaeum sp.]
KVAAVACLVFVSCTPMAEPAKRGTTPEPPQNTPGAVIRLEDTSLEAAEAPQAAEAPKPAKKQGYDSSADPFSIEGAGIIQKLDLTGDYRSKVQKLFSKLRRGGDKGVTVMDMAGKPPRTAMEVFEKGGDCTDLTNLVIGILKVEAIPGGALVAHFKGDSAGLEHMVPYAELDGKKVIIDLQTSELGKTQQGKYDVVLTLNYEQAASMYHREYGDYFKDQGKDSEAMVAYNRAVEIFDGDPYVHQNLGVLYEKNGDMESAARHFKKAAELDPKYSKDQKRGSYNEELQAGQEAYDKKDWEGCITHFKNALDSGEKLSKQEKGVIESYVDACESKSGTVGN